ncbi:MAG: ABC transporter substrate-binding protein, partial [Propionivibrio sp.]
LITKDDGYKVPETVKQTKALIEEAQPIALFGYVGTGNIEAILKEKILEDNGIPLVMVRTGASSLAKSGNPWMFITRAGYSGEINKIFQLYSSTGYKNYAVFYQDDPFGQDGLASAEAVAEKYGSKIVAKGSYEKNTTEVANAVKTIVAAAPHAVIMVSNTAASAAFIKKAKDAGLRTQFVSISTTDAAQLVDLIGAPTAAGVAITQVVPHPDNRAVPLSKEFKDNFEKFKPEGVLYNHVLLEGYVGAKVLVEGLRRAGPGATRKKLRDALEQIKNYDVGDLVVSYSPGNHVGTTFADINIISNNGKLLK